MAAYDHDPSPPIYSDLITRCHVTRTVGRCRFKRKSGIISGITCKRYKNLEVFVVLQLMFLFFWDMKLLQIPLGYFDLSRVGHIVASKFRDPIFHGVVASQQNALIRIFEMRFKTEWQLNRVL